MPNGKIVSRPGGSGVVETAMGMRPGTPSPMMTPSGMVVLRPGAAGAGASVIASGVERPGTPRPKTVGGRKTRRKTRRHRGGGSLTVIQDGSVWRIKETMSDGQSAVSPRTFSSFEDAAQMAKSLKTIKGITPDQPERQAIARAADALSRVTKTEKSLGGKRRRRRHH